MPENAIITESLTVPTSRLQGRHREPQPEELDIREGHEGVETRLPLDFNYETRIYKQSG